MSTKGCYPLFCYWLYDAAIKYVWPYVPRVLLPVAWAAIGLWVLLVALETIARWLFDWRTVER